MTRGNRRRGILVAIACICTFAAINTGAAWAKTLTLELGGTPLVTGSTADTGLSLANCLTYSEGVVAVNGAGKDKLTATSNAFEECEVGTSTSGVITETQISSTKATLIGPITITEPGPCAYVFKKLKGTVEAGKAKFQGTAKGKLNKAVSASTCPKTVVEEFHARATNEPGEVPFELVVS